MSVPLHIAMVVARFPPYQGGSELQAYSLAKKLSSMGLQLSVITQHLSAGTPAQETLEGIRVHRVALSGTGKPWESGSFIVNALSCLRTLRPNIVHAHMLSSPAVVAAAAKRLWNIPAIAKGSGVQRTGEIVGAQGSFLRRFKLSCLKENLDKVVCTLSLMRMEFLECGFQERQICFIPNGVDLDRFSPAEKSKREELRRRFKVLPESRVTLYSGRLSEEKGVDILLDAWSGMKKDSRDWLWILGEGPEKRALVARGVPQVRWFGNVPSMETYLSMADLFVLSSRCEALSNSLLEAMASMLACLVTDVGGNREVITHERNGILVPPESPLLLRQQLETLLNNPLLREKLGEEARRTVEQRYDLQKVARSYLQLYEELLSR